MVCLGVALTACGGSEQESGPEPTDPPTNLVWQRFQGVPVPCADQGPKVCWKTAATGFERSGAGAAVAAISATIRMSVASDSQVAEVVGTLVQPSAARDEWIVNRALISITSPVPQDQAPVVIGYTIADYTPDKASVTIVSRQPDTSLTENIATVVWSASGDWLLQLPETGDESRVSVVQRVPAEMIRVPVYP